MWFCGFFLEAQISKSILSKVFLFLFHIKERDSKAYRKCIFFIFLRQILQIWFKQISICLMNHLNYNFLFLHWKPKLEMTNNHCLTNVEAHQSSEPLFDDTIDTECHPSHIAWHDDESAGIRLKISPFQIRHEPQSLFTPMINLLRCIIIQKSDCSFKLFRMQWMKLNR